MWDTAAYFSKFLGFVRQCVESDYHESIKRYLSNHVVKRVKRVENLFRKLCKEKHLQEVADHVYDLVQLAMILFNMDDDENISM